MLSNVIENERDEWIPTNASLYDYSVWLVRYVRGNEYAEEIEKKAYTRDYLQFDYEVFVFFSAWDSHIIDITDNSGKSLCTQSAPLSRKPGIVSVPYPTIIYGVTKDRRSLRICWFTTKIPRGLVLGLEKTPSLRTRSFKSCVSHTYQSMPSLRPRMSANIPWRLTLH